MAAAPASNSSPRNRLLAALPPEEYEQLQPYLELVALGFKQILYQPREPIEYVYFPNNGVISMLNFTEEGQSVEVGTVGNEGMVGLPIFWGAQEIPGQAFSQVPGEALRISTEAFQREVKPEGTLYRLLQRYTQALFNMVAQNATCNRLHSIEERCCRWLLMTRDRVDTDDFPLTQEFLAQMLGVHRASVSVVAATMQKTGFIRYSRGKMTIVDRAGLEDISCECYGVINGEFKRLFGANSTNNR
jgi:CRP-like cAMP-binding protein